MAVSLPVKMAEAKEAGTNFFIELYRLELPSYTLLLASCDEDIQFAGETYNAFPIKRGEITKTVDSRVDNCDIEISNVNDSFTLALFNGKSFLGSRAYVYKILYPDSLNDENIVHLVFYGQIDSPELTENATFKCSIVSDLPNMDNCRTMQYCCSAAFGDANCGKTPVAVTNSSFSFGTGSFNGVSRQTIKDSKLSGNYWGNAIVFVDGMSRRVITWDSSSNTVYLEYAFPDNVDISGGYKIVQDCDKTPACCGNYNNLTRYGGFLFIPFEFVAKA